MCESNFQLKFDARRDKMGLHYDAIIFITKRAVF